MKYYDLARFNPFLFLAGISSKSTIDKSPPGERRVGCVTYQVCFRVHVSVFEHVDSYDRMKCQNIKAGMF